MSRNVVAEEEAYGTELRAFAHGWALRLLRTPRYQALLHEMLADAKVEDPARFLAFLAALAGVKER